MPSAKWICTPICTTSILLFCTTEWKKYDCVNFSEFYSPTHSHGTGYIQVNIEVGSWNLSLGQNLIWQVEKPEEGLQTHGHLHRYGHTQETGKVRKLSNSNRTRHKTCGLSKMKAYVSKTKPNAIGWKWTMKSSDESTAPVPEWG